MALSYMNLDDRTRQNMLLVLSEDIAQKNVYVSSRLNGLGAQRYVDLLKKSIVEGSDQTLAVSLVGMFNNMEQKNIFGKLCFAKIPYTANVTLAESEFNRYYIRALCKIAIEDGVNQILVYRAKETSSHRPESNTLEGRILDAHQVMEDLKQCIGKAPSLGIPNPNSGLSVKLINFEEAS